MGIAVYCVNVTKKSCVKPSLFSRTKTERKILILKINYIVLCAKKFLLNTASIHLEPRAVEDLKLKQ